MHFENCCLIFVEIYLCPYESNEINTRFTHAECCKAFLRRDQTTKIKRYTAEGRLESL